MGVFSEITADNAVAYNSLIPKDLRDLFREMWAVLVEDQWYLNEPFSDQMKEDVQGFFEAFVEDNPQTREKDITLLMQNVFSYKKDGKFLWYKDLVFRAGKPHDRIETVGRQKLLDRKNLDIGEEDTTETGKPAPSRPRKPASKPKSTRKTETGQSGTKVLYLNANNEIRNGSRYFNPSVENVFKKQRQFMKKKGTPLDMVRLQEVLDEHHGVPWILENLAAILHERPEPKGVLTGARTRATAKELKSFRLFYITRTRGWEDTTDEHGNSVGEYQNAQSQEDAEEEEEPVGRGENSDEERNSIDVTRFPKRDRKLSSKMKDIKDEDSSKRKNDKQSSSPRKILRLEQKSPIVVLESPQNDPIFGSSKFSAKRRALKNQAANPTNPSESLPPQSTSLPTANLQFPFIQQETAKANHDQALLSVTLDHLNNAKGFYTLSKNITMSLSDKNKYIHDMCAQMEEYSTTILQAVVNSLAEGSQTVAQQNSLIAQQKPFQNAVGNTTTHNEMGSGQSFFGSHTPGGLPVLSSTYHDNNVPDQQSSAPAVLTHMPFSNFNEF